MQTGPIRIRLTKSHEVDQGIDVEDFTKRLGILRKIRGKSKTLRTHRTGARRRV